MVIDLEMDIQFLNDKVMLLRINQLLIFYFLLRLLTVFQLFFVIFISQHVFFMPT